MAGRAFMVARVLFPWLTAGRNTITPHPAGDHEGPPNPSSTTLAPTDHPASCLTSRLRVMRIRADQSAVGAVNRPLRAIYNYLVLRGSFMFVSCFSCILLLWHTRLDIS